MEAADKNAQAIEARMAALTLTANIPFAGSAFSRQARRLYVGACAHLFNLINFS